MAPCNHQSLGGRGETKETPTRPSQQTLEGEEGEGT
jgi:hypothetical protein